MTRRKKSFADIKKNFPPEITNELLAKQFLQFARDRYPSADKAIQTVNAIISKADIQDPIKLTHARIIFLSAMRNAVRQVNPNYAYTSPQHRDEVFAAIIEALEGLEEELEELEEEAFLDEEEEREEEIEDIDIDDFGFDMEF
jgi:type III secretion protein W